MQGVKFLTLFHPDVQILGDRVSCFPVRALTWTGDALRLSLLQVPGFTVSAQARFSALWALWLQEMKVNLKAAAETWCASCEWLTDQDV